MDEYEKEREAGNVLFRKLGTSTIDSDNLGKVNTHTDVASRESLRERSRESLRERSGESLRERSRESLRERSGESLRERYDISDYSIFDDAALAIHNLNSNLEDCRDSVQTIKEILQDKNIFEGSVADICATQLDKEYEKFDITIDHFSLINRYLTEAVSKYKQADLNAERKYYF